MAYNVKRTILVGLGGTGRDAVLNAKRDLLKAYGEIPPSVKFLVFDTTNPKVLEGEVEIKLKPTEFTHLKVKNVGSVLRNRANIKKWWPDSTPSRAILDGAGQIRALGRVALHANSNDVISSIESTISDARNYRVDRDNSKFDVIGDDVSVSIVASTSGGTGGGTFLEIAWLFRKYLDENDKITSYILLPDIFRPLPATDNVRANCYAAIKELDYFMNLEQGSDFKIDLGDNESIDTKTQPFNIIYLVNNRNKQGTEYSDINELTEFLGIGLFLSTGALSKTGSDIWDNLRNQIAGKKKTKGKSAIYNSFGVSGIVYNGTKLLNLFSYETALKILNSYNTSTSLDINQEMNDFIDRLNIREDRDRDDVIDSILPNSTKSMELPEFKKGSSKRISDIKVSYINKIEIEAENQSNKNLESLTSRILLSLNEFIVSGLDSISGLDFCIKFSNTLSGTINAFKEMMISEKEEFEIKLSRIENKYATLIEDIETAEKKFFGTEKAIEESCLSFQNNAKNDALTRIDIKRREKSLAFFANISETLKKWQIDLVDVSNHINKLIQSFSSEAQQIRSKKQNVKAFILNLEDSLVDKIDTGNIDVSDFLKFLKMRKNSVSMWNKLRTSEIYDLIVEYCKSKPSAKKFTETNIENELEKLSESEKLKIIQQLDKMAIPLWQYDSGIVSNTELIYLFGVPNAEETILADENMQNVLEGKKYKPSIVSINDPNRIYFFKIEASAPGFAVQKFQEYKRDYSDPNAPFYYHLDKNWEEFLPDLFPEAEDEESRKYWSLGFVPEFGLLEKSGRSYRLKSKGYGNEIDDYWIKIPEGRRKSAMIKFLEQEELVAEIKENIELKVKNFGQAKVIEAIEKHIEDLKDKGKNLDQETKKQVELEIKLMRGYTEIFQSV